MSKLKLALIPASLFLFFSLYFYLGARDDLTASRQFQSFTAEMFQNEIVSSTLNLHYTLESPENYGINDYPVTFGSTASDSPAVKDYCQELYSISYNHLSKANQLTYDILSLYLENQKSAESLRLYQEPLGPTIGIQAQLPVLLAEYSFHSENDINTYLELLSSIDQYFSSLLAFEQEKADAGLFMCDTNADAITAQCSVFIDGNIKDNFLVTLFDEKLNSLDFLTEAQKEIYCSQNLNAVKNHVIPAYQMLIQGLNQLKGSGSNDNGLFYYPQGKAYYEYLIRDTVGSYLPVSGIKARIQKQLQEDIMKCQEILKKNPKAARIYVDCLPDDPTEILSDLLEKMENDFPAASDVNYEIKYVHPSLEEFLSPAFYLTPPIDNLLENIIYINRASDYDPLELYTTLAHEGYPGHLYQNTYPVKTNPVRSLFGFGGYSEGWATYVEMISYQYAAKNAPDETTADAITLQGLNRSVMLGISSLLDICIHYDGFTREDTARFLGNLGFVNTDSANAIFDAIIEAPVNYTKYYFGYLTFLDLRSYISGRWPDQFSLKEFHRQVLETGPCQFPVLEKALKSYYD